MATLFIIVSLPRSGTHMLRTLLNQHPNIRTESELFNEDAKPSRKWRKNSAQWVLENIAWCESAEQIRGCVAHLGQGHTWGIWQHLPNLADVRYLCIRRQNWVEQYLSLREALVHRHWQAYRNEQPPPVRAMTFQPHEMERYFHQVQAHWDWFEQTFADRPQLTVWYEEMCIHTEAISRQTQQFLGADVMEGLQPDTVKVGRPAKELIENYEELSRYFSGSPYQRFFKSESPVRLKTVA
jgi:hypothetical protein